MRTDRMRESDNVEDRRGVGPGMAAGGLGLGGVVLVLIYVLLGGNPQTLLQNMPPSGGQGSGVSAPTGTRGVPADDPTAKLVAKVLGDTEDVWADLFRQMGRAYTPPRLILFSGRVDSACGLASSAVGPFYCPADRRVYIDLNFYSELSTRFGAPGDFAQAYVIAHEVGHHVQNLLGTSAKVDAQRGRVSEREMNDLSVRLELQADFYAGVWAHHANKARQILEPGDIDEGIRAAGAVGDDRLQMQATGHVVPDSFTHGTSEQRIRWFKLGFESGDVRKGDTFSVPRP
ncbi:MAG: zinc metallopeptidase [Phycisphaerales bacterium]|nr:zinc metallopeptidase [Phycisphaerales bacterium]